MFAVDRDDTKMTKNDVSVSEIGLMWFKTDLKLAKILHLDLVIWEFLLGNHGKHFF